MQCAIIKHERELYPSSVELYSEKRVVEGMVMVRGKWRVVNTSDDGDGDGDGYPRMD